MVSKVGSKSFLPSYKFFAPPILTSCLFVLVIPDSLASAASFTNSPNVFASCWTVFLNSYSCRGTSVQSYDDICYGAFVSPSASAELKNGESCAVEFETEQK